MSRLHTQEQLHAPPPLGCGGGGVRYIEKLERYPARELEPGVVRRACALVRTVLGLSARAAPRGGSAAPKPGGETR